MKPISLSLALEAFLRSLNVENGRQLQQRNLIVKKKNCKVVKKSNKMIRAE